MLDTANDIKENKPQKIGGWLILLAIGLVLNPIRLIVFLSSAVFPKVVYWNDVLFSCFYYNRFSYSVNHYSEYLFFR